MVGSAGLQRGQPAGAFRVLRHGSPKTRLKVPEGKGSFVTTRQKDPNEKGLVGYETNWEQFHKETPYTTPKKP